MKRMTVANAHALAKHCKAYAKIVTQVRSTTTCTKCFILSQTMMTMNFMHARIVAARIWTYSKEGTVYTLRTAAIALAIALTTIFTGCTGTPSAYQQCIDNGGRRFDAAPLNGLEGGTGCEINSTYYWR